jgi:hypothetical protein
MLTYPLADIRRMLVDVPDPKKPANGFRRPSAQRPDAGRKPRALRAHCVPTPAANRARASK